MYVMRRSRNVCAISLDGQSESENVQKRRRGNVTVKVLSCRLVCPLPIQMLIEHRGQFGTARLAFVD